MFRRFFSQRTSQINPSGHFLSFIRSGAQTGVDCGALDAALHLQMPVCGWIPKNRLARKPIPSQYDLYLKEMTGDV